MNLRLRNTLTKRIDEFTPLSSERVTLYTCGPTVYDSLTVGNWAAYIYWDVLVRTLLMNGYKVDRVMNITDVGHLVSDEDVGEDKLEKGARREGKTAWEIAEKYTKDFMKGMEALGLILPEHITKATDFIPQQLDLVRVLKEKGYTYQIDDGIYFDTSKFPAYADFAGLDLNAQKAGARVAINTEKRNQSDFALWKFTPDGQKRDMQWETPSDITDDGSTPMGFPGWHLECSAMAMTLLGNTIDIHTGGIDHIPVHHTNEIAQSEAASGEKFADYWVHCNHLKVDGRKISKSLGNGFTLQQLEEKGYEPLDYRMFVLQGQYTNEGNFTFENLAAAKARRLHWRDIAALRHQAHDTLAQAKSEEEFPSLAVIGAIKEALNNNLNTPEALRLIDDVFTQLEARSLDKIDRQALVDLLEEIDELLGLQLLGTTPDISEDAKHLILERERAREEKDWRRADELRDELTAEGVEIRDTPGGTVWSYS